MDNRPVIPQTTQTTSSSGQRQSQPAHSAFSAVAQHPQWSHFQAPPYNPQWMVPQSLLPPPPALSAHGPQWHGQQRQYQQRHNHIPPVVPPLPQLVAQPNYNSYQPTAGYPQYHLPQPVTFPQLAYYPHPQTQQQRQQEGWYHTPPQHLVQMPAGLQQFDSPNLNRQAQQHVPPPPQPPPSPAQNDEVYPYHKRPERLNNAQLSAMKGGRGATAGKSRDGSPGSGGRQRVQFGGGVRDRDSEGNLGEAASIQAEGRNTIPTSAEPTAVPVATQFQGAKNVNVSGNPTLMNIGTNRGNLTTVNNYGGTYGLEKLERFVSFAALHNSAEQDHTRRCHPGTRENVLGRLRHWSDNPNPTDRIFWLHGPAGAGKSAIAQTIAHTYNQGEVAATFFFYRSDPNRNDGNRLFTTIAWQLAFSVLAIKDFIVQALDKLPHLPMTDVETQFEALVVNPTRNIASQMPQPAPVVIIDGVDECSDEKLQQRFLTVIGNAIKNHRVPLRFLIVSRPEALIEETLKKFKDFAVFIDLAKLDDSNRDIQKYLKDKFFEIASDRGLDPTWPGQEIIKEIVFKSSGNFIFASLVIRFISDEDCDPEFLLNIVRNLTPRGGMLPFALLDELFLEILKQQRDQAFVKTFLALLVARTSIKQKDLHEDDTTLMNVSEKDLHIRLRRMRSLLKFEPFIDVHHKSFLDFLQDPFRSGQFHVSKQGGQKRYLELIVDSVVRHVSMAIEQPNYHWTCRSSPIFKCIVMSQPPKIVLPVEDWQEVLKPLLDLQDKLLKTSKPQSCRVTQIMRDLLLHLVVLQGKTYPITAAQVSESNLNETATERRAQQNISEKYLDSSLSGLLSCIRFQKTDSVIIVDKAIIDRMFSLLAFDSVQIVARVHTISDAQNLIDLIDLLTNDESFLSHCGPDAACKAARLASAIFARVPLLPQSLFLNKPGHYIRLIIPDLFELECQSAFISSILDHNYIVPVSGIYDGSNRLRLASGNENEQNEFVHVWLRRSIPNLVTRIRVILEIAKTIRYIHSMDIALDSSFIEPKYFLLNSNLRVKFEFFGLFVWWVREASKYGHEYPSFTTCTYESNIYAFARLFHKVCFEDYNDNLSNRLVEDAMQLIERCCAEDRKSQPTMKDVVTEMGTWNLT